VFTPSLTGIGERVHLASPQVNLTTHVTDVVNTILYEDLENIVLLGFSYGGMVVTGALEYVADRVAHLVYLDAFMPANGESLHDLAHAGHSKGAIGPGGEWLVPPPARAIHDIREAAWYTARRSGCSSRSRTTRSPAPTSRPPRSRAPRPETGPARSGGRPTTRRPAPPGVTGRSTPTT